MGPIVNLKTAQPFRGRFSARVGNPCHKGGFAVAVLCILGTLSCSGCGAPAPSSQFVDQADRLHREALSAAGASDSDLRDYVQLVGKRLMDAARDVDAGRTRDPMFLGMQFHLAACDVPNVITTGGRHIYVLSGLFPYCQTEDDLAAAMSHAVAHAVALDLERIDIRPDPNLPIPLIAWDMVSHRYTMDQERSADRFGYEMYLRAGYDPGKFTSVFEHVAARYPGVQSPDRKSAAMRIAEARSLGIPIEGPANRPLPVADPKTFLSLRDQAHGSRALQPGSLPELILESFPNCMLPGDTPEQEAARQQLRPLPPAKRLEPS